MLIETTRLWPDRPDVVLKAFIPDELPVNSQAALRPALIICPGGSYLGTSDREADPVALRFVENGYPSFVLRYSTYNYGHMDGMENPETPAGNPNAAFPGPLLDLGRAMLVIRGNTCRWQADPDRLAICGFSAGGHLSASLAVHWHEDWLAEALDCDSADIRPAGIILGYPLTDYRFMKICADMMRESSPGLQDLWHYSNTAVFGKSEPTDEDLARLTPVLHVSEKTPPAFIWHTADDALVPVANSLNLAGALALKGVPCELHVFEKGRHGMSLADETTAEHPEHISEQARQWVPMAINWLERHLPPSGPV